MLIEDAYLPFFHVELTPIAGCCLRCILILISTSITYFTRVQSPINCCIIKVIPQPRYISMLCLCDNGTDVANTMTPTSQAVFGRMCFLGPFY